MEIAKGIREDMWIELNLSSDNQNDWNIGINILRKRINERYFEPIDKLIESEANVNPVDRKYGFIILAIDCLIIETLQSFYLGIQATKGSSKKTFIDFFTNSKNFKLDFSSLIDGKTRAEHFFYDFRCGILHQAEIGKRSRVLSIGSIVSESKGNLIINRTEFHHRLKKEFNDYLVTLTNGDNLLLRKNFVKKMDYISKNPTPRYPDNRMNQPKGEK